MRYNLKNLNVQKRTLWKLNWMHFFQYDLQIYGYMNNISCSASGDSRATDIISWIQRYTFSKSPEPSKYKLYGAINILIEEEAVGLPDWDFYIFNIFVIHIPDLLVLGQSEIILVLVFSGNNFLIPYDTETIVCASR